MASFKEFVLAMGHLESLGTQLWITVSVVNKYSASIELLVFGC